MRVCGLFAVLSAAAVLAPAQDASVLSVDEAVRLALANNETLKVEAYSPEIARADVLAEKGRFDPALNFQRSYAEASTRDTADPLLRDVSRTDEYALSLDGLAPWGLAYSLETRAHNDRESSTLFTSRFATFGGVRVLQPLLRGFGPSNNLLGLRLAKADRAISDWEFRQAAIDTVTRVVTAYSDLLLAKENLQIALRSKELATSLLKENEKRFSYGSMAQSDVTEVRARFARREEAILSAERNVRDVDNALRRLLGESQFSPTGPLLAVVPPPYQEYVIKLEEDLRRAMELRPDYQAARVDVTKRRMVVSSARNQLLPRLDFVGSYGYSGLDRDFAASRRMVRDQDNRSYSAGVVVSIPLTFAGERGRMRAARLSQRQIEADLLRLEGDIRQVIVAAAGQLETCRQRIAATRAAFDLANEVLDAELKKLRAGTSTTFQVLSQQDALASAEISLHRAFADQRRAVAAYERETAVTLIRRNIAFREP